MFCVYQLRLENNRHYFGTTKSHRKETRLEEHRAGRGSKWTRRFPPVLLYPVVQCWYFETRRLAYAFEDQMCCEFLNLYGIDSTRGGLQNADLGCPYDCWVRPHLQPLVPI